MSINITDLSNLISRVEGIMERRNMVMVEYSNENGYMFEIQNSLNNEPEGHIEIGKTDTQIPGKTRSTYDVGTNVDTFHISWINTEPGYKGKGVSKLLIIYAICKLKLMNSDVEYATLDDDSDAGGKLTSNLYDSIGFGYSGLTKLSNINKMLDIEGPEKYMLLDRNFIRLANRVLDKEESKERVIKRVRDEEEDQEKRIKETTKLSTPTTSIGGRRIKNTQRRKTHYRKSKKTRTRRRGRGRHTRRIHRI